MSVLARNSFLGQNHMRVACFCPVFMYTAKSGNRYTFLPESPFYTLLPGATFLGQNHMRVPCFRPVFMYTANVGLPIHVFPRKSVLHVVARRYVFWPKSHARTMISPSFHVHGQRRVYTGKVRLPIHVFARKSVLHVVARRYVFWPKSHARTMISPSFHVHGQRRVYTGKVG